MWRVCKFAALCYNGLFNLWYTGVELSENASHLIVGFQGVWIVFLCIVWCGTIQVCCVEDDYAMFCNLSWTLYRDWNTCPNMEMFPLLLVILSQLFRTVKLVFNKIFFVPVSLSWCCHKVYNDWPYNLVIDVQCTVFYVVIILGSFWGSWKPHLSFY